MRKLRTTPLKKKVKLQHHGLQGTATDQRENSVIKSLIRNDSESWAEQSGTTTLSWPEDMEEVATKRVTQQWDAVERTLYDENEQLALGPCFDECLQWQNQLPHLRIVGKNHQNGAEEPTSNTDFSLKRKQQSLEIEEAGEINSNNNFLLEDSGGSTSGSHKRAREDVVDELMEYVNSALVLQDNVEEENMLSHDLEELLTITPAPTNNFRSIVSSCKPIQRNDNSQKCDSDEASCRTKTENEAKDAEKVLWNRRTAMSARQPTEETSFESETQLHRNKAGTIFNEKIIVSPVPFVRSTRESFCTLQTAPIQILGQATSTTWNRGASKHINSGRKLTSGRKTSLIRGPQIHSAWQPPVCPTVWPKNVRLAPIKLPNTKQRTISAAPQRGRGPLSPIPQTTLPTSLQKSNTNPKELLEIHGTHILGQSQKGDELKSNFNQTPKQKSSGRKKARHKVDNV